MADSFPGAMIFLRVPVRESGALDGKFLFLYNGVFVGKPSFFDN
jgi:hypothetical protein